MKRTNVFILGASGMLGSMITDYMSRNSTFNLCATVRSAKILKSQQKRYPTIKWYIFEAFSERSVKSFSHVLKQTDWIINAIGMIKPYINEQFPTSVVQAIRLNSLLPFRLVSLVGRRNIHIIQIGTDCVFSGHKGKYHENDIHDALDLYGKTKSLGEVTADNFYNLRCSIIGPELKNNLSLLGWFLSHKHGATVAGYTNHFWNGITTLHFAKICQAIITHNINLASLQHIIPSDVISKATLLSYLTKEFHREDIHIKPVDAPQSVNRTLDSRSPALNKKIWRIAGYAKPPTIRVMVEELGQYYRSHKTGTI